MNEREKLVEATKLAIQGKLVEEETEIDKHLSKQDLDKLSNDLKNLSDKQGYDIDEINRQLNDIFDKTWTELFGKYSSIMRGSPQEKQLTYTALDRFFEENPDIRSKRDALQWIYDKYEDFGGKYVRMYLRNRFDIK